MTPSTTPSVLLSICDRTRARLAATPPDIAALETAIAARRPARDALAALTPMPGQARIIAEIKRHSPSAGALNADVDPVAMATTYATHGAAAISVLTEPERFGGSFADLDAVSAAVAVPTLCKDFMVDSRQFLMARAHGASLVLLIVAALGDRELRDFREQAEALGMQALVETHDATEIERAVASGARIIGVNSRDLHSLRIDLAVAERLRSHIPDDVVAVAESGIHTPADIQRLGNAGYGVFLIGSSLMTAVDPGAQLAALAAAGTEWAYVAR
jgi:indole-3-glycerol phosphate synthase